MACDPAAARELATGWVAVFPDWHIDLLDLLAEGDSVVARMPWTGTQQGPLLDLPATGRRVEVDEMILFQLRDRVVVQAWEVWDEATMRRQRPGPPPPHPADQAPEHAPPRTRR